MDSGFCMSGFKGAVYFPARAYNAYQTYEYFDKEEVSRDFSYARKAGITALRIFTSYEQYLKDGEGFFSKFEALLEAAARHGVRVMPVLFENCGNDFTEERAMDRDPDTAVCVKSPCLEVVRNRSLWGPCAGYVDAFMARYADDRRLVAIEVMNEPDFRGAKDLDFARAMLERAWLTRKGVPLTIGCVTLADCLFYGDLLDVYQFHDNFPTDRDEFRRELEFAAEVKRVTGKPVWLSEWQRIRKSGPGWNKGEIPEEEKTPDLASLAPMVYESGLGSFFWCLMVKPAYLMAQRPNGTYNGLFYEDGSVYSLDDYEAVAGNRDAVERKGLPEWYMKAREEKAKGMR